MHHNVQVVVRLPAELAARLDRLVPVLARTGPWSAASRVTRSTVARLALLEGLAQLEARFAAPEEVA